LAHVSGEKTRLDLPVRIFAQEYTAAPARMLKMGGKTLKQNFGKVTVLSFLGKIERGGQHR
jgi:hypothetical protein